MICVSFGGCRSSFLVCRLSLVARYSSCVACCLLVVMDCCLSGRCLWFVVCCLLVVVVRCLFFVAVCGSLSVVCCVCLLLDVCCSLLYVCCSFCAWCVLVVRCLLSVMCRSLFVSLWGVVFIVVRCLLFCSLLFVVCCLRFGMGCLLVAVASCLCV